MIQVWLTLYNTFFFSADLFRMLHSFLMPNSLIFVQYDFLHQLTHHTCTCMSPKQLVNLSMLKTSVPEVDINKWLCVKWIAFYPNLSKRKVCSSQTAIKSNWVSSWIWTRQFRLKRKTSDFGDYRSTNQCPNR